jgi:hypothetical protein
MFRTLSLPSLACLIITISPPPQQNVVTTPKNKTSREREKTTGQGFAIASKERHFSPLAAIFENRPVTLFHSVDMVSGIHPLGITQNERFLSCDTVLLGVRFGSCTSNCTKVLDETQINIKVNCLEWTSWSYNTINYVFFHKTKWTQPILLWFNDNITVFFLCTHVAHWLTFWHRNLAFKF